MNFSLRSCSKIALALVLISNVGVTSAKAEGVQSPVAGLEDSNRLANGIVDLINQGNAEGLESLATPEFLKGKPKAAFQAIVKKIQSLGTMAEPHLILDLGEQRSYRVAIKHEGRPDFQLLIILGAESDTKYFSLGLEPYVEPKLATKPFQTDNPGKSVLDKSVQAAVDHYIGQFKPVGISVAVLNNGHESYFNYGETASGSGTLPTSHSIFEIGSITKTMTGILLAQAVVDKKLSLDDDIRTYLPGSYPNLEFDGKPIRVKDLATHTSGLPANPPGIPDDGKADAYESYNHEKLLADLAKIKLTKSPGSGFRYSNMGGGLCGLILKKIYGQPFENLLDQKLFGPAKMRHSGIAITPEMDKNYLTPHDPSGQKSERWIVNGIESAGGVRSSAEDMLKYARFNLNEKVPAVALSHKLLSQVSAQPTGIFWLRTQSRTAGPYLNHEGGTGGFTSHILVMPTKNLAVVVMMNSGEQRAGQLAYEIALRILNSEK